MLILTLQGEDELMHFKWKDRTSGNVEDDLIIFPVNLFKKSWIEIRASLAESAQMDVTALGVIIQKNC